jgi:hypothetical protein
MRNTQGRGARNRNRARLLITALCLVCTSVALGQQQVLGEAFKTIKLEGDDREALRATLHRLVDATPTLPARRGRADRGPRP